MRAPKKFWMKQKDLTKAQRTRLNVTFFAYVAIGVVILSFFCSMLYTERVHVEESWYWFFDETDPEAVEAREMGKDAQTVTVGTYVENLREINLKSSYFRVEFLVWFDWEGDEDLNPAEHFRVYKGLINKKTLLNEAHEGNQHYQLVSMDVSVSNNFATKRFPLESHQLRFFIESTKPIQEVIYVPDKENSGINRDLTITGYEFQRHDVGDFSYTYDSTHGDPTVLDKEVTSEILTAMEINRSNLGMYFKCFIALAGTITWVLITLFICTYHHVDPLSMVPAALFGTVSNIMIGASLLPDALELGLLEFVNLWGVLSILGAAIAIININQVRRRAKEEQEIAFSRFYAKVLFFTVLAFALVGQVIMPLIAYIR